MLVMAIEALLEPACRSTEATAHVEDLIRATKGRANLSERQRSSLMGSLRWLRFESINQTGRKLAEDRLGGRTYAGRKPGPFFSYCYDLRSKLVHALDTLPTRDEIATAAAHLEVFVSDLLSGKLLEVELP